MTANELSVVAGVVLSLFFSYVPNLNAKFAALSSEAKRLIMLGLLAVVAGVVYGLACAGLGADLGIAVVCDKAGAVQLVTAFVTAAIANQTAYLLSPEAKAVTAAKAAR